METTYGSVCSGIEAASVAFGPLDWRAAWFAEIAPFPAAVLAHHYPAVPNLADLTTLPARVASGEVVAPDVLVGGTPCQAFSVAGLRQSLDDARGNLSLVFCDLANAIDTARALRNLPPAVIKWENVPGVLSTKDNAFGCFLAGLAGEDDSIEPPGGKWAYSGVVHGPSRTVAWRTFDAQYFGVAQRRRRVFVVASARNDFDPVSVLFEFDSVRRDLAPRRETGQGPAAGTLRGTDGGSDVDHARAQHLIAMAHGQGGAEIGFDRSPCLTCNHEAPIAAYAVQDVTHTLRAEGFDASEDGTGRGTPLVPICFDTSQITSAATRSNPQAGDPCHPLAAGAHAPAVAFDCKASGQAGFGVGEIAGTMRAMGHAASHQNGGGHLAVATGWAVRRLTPRECERLQGFPDDYTMIPWRKKPAEQCPDGPRYKALGNSWAVPNARWVGARISAQLKG